MKNNFPTEHSPSETFAEELRREHQMQLRMRPWFFAISTAMRGGGYLALTMIDWKVALAVFFVEWGAQIKTKFIG